MNDIALNDKKEIASPGFNSASGFELMQRQAKMLSASTLVPDAYRNNISNCIIALNMANRVGADPLMVMQNLYVVHGNPGWSAKFLIASFNQCGRFSAIRYEWEGEEGTDKRRCRAWAIEKETNQRVESPWIDWSLIRGEKWDSKNGSKWKTMPEKMFMYRSAAWLIDTVAPEISMGLQTEDQLHDFYDADRGADGTYVVSSEKSINDLNSIVNGTDEITHATLSDQLRKAKTSDDIDAVEDLANALPEDHKEEIKVMCADARTALNS